RAAFHWRAAWRRCATGLCRRSALARAGRAVQRVAGAGQGAQAGGGGAPGWLCAGARDRPGADREPAVAGAADVPAAAVAGDRVVPAALAPVLCRSPRTGRGLLAGPGRAARAPWRRPGAALSAPATALTARAGLR